MIRGLAVLFLIAATGWVQADDKTPALAPCVQRLVQAQESGTTAALAAVRQAGPSVAPDLRRALQQHAGNEKTSTRLRRALEHVTEDWQRAQTPEGMVYVPAGPVEVPAESADGHRPSGKRVQVAAFYIDRTEVTVGAWRAWRPAASEKKGPLQRKRPGDPPRVEDDERLPIGEITQLAAARFAKDHCAGRLPTAAEFERALRGSGVRTYPWGDAMGPDRANLDWGKAPGRPVPVGSYPLGASPFGVLDLVGNLAEWTSTFEPYGQSGRRPLVLGGSYADEPSRGLTWRSKARPRNVQSAHSKAKWIGFRVVRTPPALP